MLSPSQQRAEKAFYKFLQDPNQQSMVIAGFGGTGKSYLIKHLLTILAAFNKANLILIPNAPIMTPILTATTNKAVSVLRKMLNTTKVSTIHSLLGLKVRNDYNKGITYLLPGKISKNITNSLIIIDESSMVSKKLYKFIQDYTANSKIIYIGDNAQLPPVFEKDSIVFKNSNIIHLNEIQRQATDNPIIPLSHQYRDIINKKPPFTWPKIQPDNKYIFKVDGPEFEDLVRTKYAVKHAPNDYKILAYTNKKVIAYNTFVRSLYTKNPDFEVNEYVITNKPIMADKMILAATDATLKITHIEDNIISKEGIKGFNIKLNSLEPRFLPKNWVEVNNLLKHHKKYKDWKQFFNIKDNYLDIRSIHSLTVHKSQGSTYREVFVDFNDIGTNTKYWEIARLVYVAITRASDKVFIYGNLPKRYE